MNEKDSTQKNLDDFNAIIEKIPNHKIETTNKRKSKIQERDQRIIDLYKQGLSCAIISSKVSLSSLTVRKILKDNNVEMRTPGEYHKKKYDIVVELYLEGTRLSEISDETGLTLYKVKSILMNRGLLLSKSEIRILQIADYIDLRFQNKTDEEISEIVNIPINNLRKLVQNSGINYSVLKRKKYPISFRKLIIDVLQGMDLTNLSINHELNQEDLKYVLEILGLWRKESLDLDLVEERTHLLKEIISSKDVSKTNKQNLEILDNEIMLDILNELTDSMKKIYRLIQNNKELSMEYLINNTSMSEKSIKYALNVLEKKKLIRKRKKFQDRTTTVYFVPN